jgi:hypothetical protein
VESLSKDPHILDTEIKTNHGGSLGRLKTKLKAKLGSK